MIDKATREKIISLIHREVVPALGCTEPIAVSLAVAKATELLGMQPEEINLGLSGNIIKNAMGVGRFLPVHQYDILFYLHTSGHLDDPV